MLVIGLTGGIASGKTTVSDLLARKGAHVINADLLGHESYRSGTPTWQEVVDTFGPEIVGADGEIDRKELGRIVFSDAAARQKLNGIVWPAIRRLMEARLPELRQRGAPKVVVLEAALLIEAVWYDLADEVWLVTVSEEEAIQRLVSRNGLSQEEALKRIRSQLSDEERRRYAQVVIGNSGTLEALEAAVQRQWELLQRRLHSGTRV